MFPLEEKRGGAGQQRCEHQGVSEAAMAEKVAIVDAEPESNHIEVRNHRANRPHRQRALGNLRIKAAADTQGHRGMREDGRHTFAAMSLTRLRDALPIEEQPFYRGVRFDDGNRDSQEIGQARIVDRKKKKGRNFFRPFGFIV